MRFLSGIRKKILGTFLLAFVMLVAAGVVAFYSLEKILVTVDEIAVPDKSIALMYDIFADLSLISNYNRIYSITNEHKYQKQIEEVAQKIRLKSDTLEVLLQSRPLQKKQLDSLQILIENISEDSKRLAKAKQNASMNDVTARLTQQILEHVKTDSTLFRDSTYVVKKTTSEVKVSDFLVRQIDSLAKSNPDPKNMGFFQKLNYLFSGKRSSSLVDTLYVKPERQIDTLTTISKDSVFLLSRDEFILKLDSLLRKFSVDERAMLSQINTMELNFTRRNNELIEKARNIILLINRQTIQSTFKEINKATKISSDSKNIILLIILFFVISGILLATFVFMDLSKSNYYQEELFEAKKNAEQSAKSKLDFLAKMSHEIRSPLTSILGFANLIESDGEYVKIIKNSSNQLLNTANEILDLAKVDNGIIEINNQPFDLMEFLKYLVMDFEMKIQNKGLKFITEFPGEKKIVINSDEFRLQQIITNLLNNALKFTEKGYVKLIVERGLEREDKVDIRITVEDTGLGIKSENLNRIFEEFKQFGSVTSKKLGFGLGLSIVKKLVQRLGGNLSVKSIPDVGTHFKLHFTFEKAKIDGPEEMETPGHSHSLKGKKIVVIDDDPTILKLLVILLKKYQAEVTAFDNPEDTLTFFSNQSCDLCLMDIQLSGFSGLELCKEVRRRPSAKGLKIVAFTANLIENTKEDLLNAGFDDLILKPIFEKELIEKLMQILGITVSPDDLSGFVPPVVQTEVPIESGVNRLDLTEIEKFAFGDVQVINDIVDQFVRDTEMDLANLERGLSDSNGAGIAEILHKLTSRMKQFGLKRLALSAKEIESEILLKKTIPDKKLRDFLRSGRECMEQVKAQAI